MTDPLISIIMITYNHAPYISEAIEGVLQQKTDFPFELVIGEDCSTDGTREIVFEYQKKYPEIIRVITSDKNVGMKANSVRTKKVLRGKYVAFCEGDDYWHNPGKLQLQTEYMENHPECGVTHSNFDIFIGESNKIVKDYIGFRKFEVPRKMNIYDILDDCGIGFWIRTCTAMVRRDQYERLTYADPYLYQSGHFLMGDEQLWAEISLTSEVIFFPEAMATYRILGESASHSNNPIKKAVFNRSASELKLYLCDKHKLPAEFRRKMEHVWFEHSLRLAFLQKNKDLALEIKKKKQNFTYKDWLRYYGARNSMCHYLFRLIDYIRSLFGNELHIG
ncbi:MAG: glycosyltransferase [Candidatus Latescibacteria bacterium]|nr:glycosyltransferase [Candidatus Latescibacterota bacterium]